jgi:hypothetical protein
MKLESDGHMTCPKCASSAIKVTQCKSGYPLILRCCGCGTEGPGEKFPVVKSA